MVIVGTILSIIALFAEDYRPVAPKNSDFQRGISYVPFDTDLLLDEEEYKNIDQMLNIGATWVSIVPIWYQDNETSTEITSDYELAPSDKSILEFVHNLQEKDIKIMLKPMVDAIDQTWRAKFEPTNWSVWFASYQNFIWHFADMAEEEEIELFCVGCEYTSSDQDLYDNWSVTIEGIRARYSGDIVYAADYPSYDKVCFWDLLDYVGIDSYFPLYEGENPSLADLIDGWNTALDEVEEWLKESGNDDKNVIFTEVGYEAQPNCWESPGFTGSDELDVNAQDMCFKAMFSTAPGKAWLEGIFIWWWDNPTTHDAGGGLNDNGWTPKGKPAENTITNYYKYSFGFSVRIFLIIMFMIDLSAIGIIIILHKRKKIRISRNTT